MYALSSSGAMSTTELLIIGTNLAIVLATLALTRVTGRDAQLTARMLVKEDAKIMAQQSKNTRLLYRLLGRNIGPGTDGGKHRNA